MELIVLTALVVLGAVALIRWAASAPSRRRRANARARVLLTTIAADAERARQHAAAFFERSREHEALRYSLPSVLGLHDYVLGLAKEHGYVLVDSAQLPDGKLEYRFARRSSSAELTDAKLPAQGSARVPAFAVLDVETTGLSARNDRVLELAIVRLDRAGAVIDEWRSLFDPEGPVGATHIHGITQSDVSGAPSFRDLARGIAERLRGLPVVAHNASFDLAFLRAEFERAGWDMPWVASYCTLTASRRHHPHLDRHRLTDVCWAVGVMLENAHSALGDARATAGLLRHFLTSRASNIDLQEVVLEARASQWPNRPSREPVQALPDAPRRARPVRITPPRPKRPPLVEQLNGLSILELLDEGAGEGTIAYLELLTESLEDGELSEAEAAGLADLIELYRFTPDDVTMAHTAFILALAHRALDDGHVSRAERAELHAMAELLQVPKKVVLNAIQRADQARAARLSAGLRPLPDDWPFGDPLRVGHKVAFTGCEEEQRILLEKRAESLGVRVIGSVSRLTVILVTDGSFSGTKLAKAQELGTRIVHPDVFDVLLDHLQPTATTRPHREGSRPLSAPAPTTAPRASMAGDNTPTPTVSVPSVSASPSQIRAWATANGYTVGVRGRLPREVVQAFEQAHTG